MSGKQQEFWVVLPAAGSGERMGADRPKQYLTLAGKTLLEHTLERLLDHPDIKGLVVVLADSDRYWENTAFADDHRVLVTQGGEQRCHSVLAGLEKAAETVPDQNWVMVHDVARPCISQDDLNRLIAATSDESDGLVLGAPVRDTMKQTDAAATIVATADRSQLWHAFTPQVFRLGQLQEALRNCLQQGLIVTDEASAMEQSGYSPRMVQGSEHNIKVTRPEDLLLAEWILGREDRA